MMRYLHVIGATFLLLASQSVTARNAEDPRRAEGLARIRKSAWEWTTEERLAERFNPSRIQERELAYEARVPRAAGSSRRAKTEISSDGRQPVVSGIDGTRNPELFLPYELFDALMTGFEPDQSLRTEQRAFGRTRFDVLLYTVVAPTLQYSETTFDPDPAAKHRRAEAGCR